MNKDLSILLPELNSQQLSLLQRHIDECVREAKVEELEQLQASGKSYGYGVTFLIDNKYFQDRITELLTQSNVNDEEF